MSTEPEAAYCPTNSRDESINACTAPVQSVRFTLPKDPREIIVAVILALSIMVNLWAGWVIRDVGTQKWLHDYDLNQFQMNQFATVQKDVEVTKELVRNYGIGAQKCVK